MGCYSIICVYTFSVVHSLIQFLWATRVTDSQQITWTFTYRRLLLVVMGNNTGLCTAPGFHQMDVVLPSRVIAETSMYS